MLYRTCILTFELNNISSKQSKSLYSHLFVKMNNTIDFVTEIASTHNGNFKTIKFLSDKHLLTGSKYLKYQIFKTNNLYSKSDSNYKIYKKIEITFKNWEN